VRVEQGRDKEPSLVIVDSQSVKTPAFSGEEAGYDGGKKVKGRKRHIVERTFAWLQNFRRLAKDYEKTLHMAKAMILMGAIVISLRKLII
jgi:hypothetical protein